MPGFFPGFSSPGRGETCPCGGGPGPAGISRVDDAPSVCHVSRDAMKRWRRLLFVLLTISACVGFDQSTKAFARWHLPKSGAISLAGDALRLQYAENKGAVLAFET